MLSKVGIVVWLFSIGSCLEKDAVYWAPYNQDSDQIAVDVGAEQADARSTELLSTTGSTVVGEGLVSPGAGPVGTEHTIQVLMVEEFQDDVGRVTIEIEGSRGVSTHELIQDSAQPELWLVDVTSVGEAQETRQDEIRFTLWQEAEKGDAGAVKEE